MKKLIAFILLFSFLTSGTETFAFSGKKAAEFDITAESGFSAEELSKGLLGELSAFSEDFIAAEEKYGVNAVFLCAVAALESGWGRYCFRPNNIFGWSGKDFSTKEECIDFVASKIAEHYLSENGKYYNGKTVSGVNICYNGNDFWEEKVIGIMGMIFRKISAKNG